MPIYHLTLNSALHQGEFLGIYRETVLDHIPSDSLYAALVTTWSSASTQGLSAHLPCNDGNGSPSFTLTSAFPLAGTVRFYPAPPRLPEHAGFPPGDKTAKKLRWLSSGVLQQLQSKQKPEQDDEVNFLHGKTVWLTRDEFAAVQPLLQFDAQGKPALWGEQTAPRVTVDRLSNASNLFFSGRMVFAAGCGLWFALRDVESWATRAMPEALNILKDNGLGGLRSTGHGSFTWQQADDDLPAATDYFGYGLARFAPHTLEEAQALQDGRSAYALETVGGWCYDDAGQSWRRKAVRLVASGALLPVAGLVGKAVNVRPDGVGAWNPADRPVWRAAYAFFIPAGELVEVKL